MITALRSTTELPGNVNERTDYNTVKLVFSSLKLFPAYFIYIAPFPIFSRFVGFNNWVTCTFEVLLGMLVFGVITTPNVTTSKTESQMYPFVSCFETLFTTICRWFDFFNLIFMRTLCAHFAFKSF